MNPAATSARVYIPADSAALSVGADRAARAIAEEAQARGIELALVRTGSRGLFWLEPMVEVETAEGRFAYGPIVPGDAPSLFQAGFLAGGAHPKALGLVEDIPYLKNQQRLIFARCGVVDPLSLDDYRRHGGLAGLEQAIALGSERTIAEVLASGLRGRGGAGFPTGIKWRTVAGVAADQKYIVCNADEGDSGTYADRMLLEGDPFLLIEGMAIAALSVGATKGYVYIRSEYPHGFARFSAAIERARAAGLLVEVDEEARVQREAAVGLAVELRQPAAQLGIELVVPGRVQRVRHIHALAVERALQHLRSARERPVGARMTAVAPEQAPEPGLRAQLWVGWVAHVVVAFSKISWGSITSRTRGARGSVTSSRWIREERKPGTTSVSRASCEWHADEQAFQPKWCSSSPTLGMSVRCTIRPYCGEAGSTSTTAMKVSLRAS